MTIMVEQAVQLLEKLGAANKRHSSRSLMDHLLGTRLVLRRWQTDPAVQMAGMFHSVYDTRAYQAGFSLSREDLRHVIGYRSEKLVWHFRNIHLFERATMLREPVLVAKLSPALADLFTIGAANLVEQAAYMSTRKMGSTPYLYRNIFERYGSALPLPIAKAMRAELASL